MGCWFRDKKINDLLKKIGSESELKKKTWINVER